MRYALSSQQNILIFLIIIPLIVFFCGVNDDESIDLYLQKLQVLSEHTIKAEQQQFVREFYYYNQYRHPLRDERHKVRREFNSKKQKLKQEWETKYRIVWPKSKITSSHPPIKNMVMIVKESPYEAHHIVPINAGGINQWWNITPLSSKNHKLLHESIEEKACFSHDFIHQKVMRFILRIQVLFNGIFSGYINKKGTNYAGIEIN